MLNPISSANFQTGEDGTARIAFTPPSPGLYLLDVRSGGAESQVLAWVGGTGSGDWPELPGGQLPLKVVGQGDQLFIPNPFSGPAQAIVTMAAGEAQAVQIEDGGQEVALPASGETVSVTLLGKAPDGTPGLLRGSLDLPEKPSLQIKIDRSSQTLLPGERLSLHLLAQDSQGRPVPAEFSLALVDPAVLSPETEDSLTSPGQVLYWSGSLTGGADGVDANNVQIPDRSQSWRAIAHAVTEDGASAETTLDMGAYSPLQLLPRLPGALTAGDHATLPVTVLNNTAQEWKGSVTLESTGLVLNAASPNSQDVTVPAGGQVQVTWMGTVVETDQVLLTFTAGDLAWPVELPVLRSTDGAAFSASGVLAEEGNRREVVALPPDLKDASGSLRVEIASSLAALVNAGLDDLLAPNRGLTDDVLLEFAPASAAGQAWDALGLEPGDSQNHRLDTAQRGISRLALRQNLDGGWGFWPGLDSDPWTSSEALISLAQAMQKAPNSFRLEVDLLMYSQARSYAQALLFAPDAGTSPAELDRLALSLYALSASGALDSPVVDRLYEFHEDLSPAGQAFLALALPPEDERSRALVQGLEQSIESNGAEQFWQTESDSPVFSTAVVTYALGRLDPASALMPDIVSFLLSRRGPDGNWSTSRESLWSWLALVEVMQGTADTRSHFTYSASLDGAPVVSGDGSGDQVGLPPSAQLALSQLNARGSLLQVQRGSGSGRLYYHAGLRLYRPVESLQPVDRGVLVERQYALEGQDCSGGCPALAAIQPGQALVVRLNVTVPKDVRDLAIEDFLPAGMDFLDAQVSPQPGLDASVFGRPGVSGGRVFWLGASVPAGSYQFAYRIVAARAGTYQVLPALAYALAQSDFGGSSAGALLEIKN